MLRAFHPGRQVRALPKGVDLGIVSPQRVPRRHRTVLLLGTVLFAQRNPLVPTSPLLLVYTTVWAGSFERAIGLHKEMEQSLLLRALSIHRRKECQISWTPLQVT